MSFGFAKTTLDVRTSNGRDVTLLEPLVYTAKSGEVITAPVGTVSDGASTPRVIWQVIPPFGPYWMATVLHDYLYRLTKQPRDYCDNMLMEAMESLGVEFLLREAIYEGVHLGGEVAFNDDRRVKLLAFMNHLAIQKAMNPTSGA